MSKSRDNGDTFEYSVVYYLRLHRIKSNNEYTTAKTEKILKKYDSQKISIRQRITQTKSIDRAFRFIFGNSKIPKSYELMKDRNSKKTTADIIIYLVNDSREIHISCKHNSYSLKHQRPSNLLNQMDATKSEQKKYKKEYDSLISAYYVKFDNKGYTQFREILKKQKNRMYKNVNKLVCKYVNKAKKLYQQAWIRFLLGINTDEDSSDEDVEIIRYTLLSKKKGGIKLMSLNKMIVTNIDAEVKDNRILVDLLDDENYIQGTLNLRIHNASSSITKNLSLKYDTTWELGSIPDLYEMHNF